MGKAKTPEAPGPGKKQCPRCQKIVGTRTKVCDCGYEYPSTAARTTRKPQTVDMAGTLSLLKDLKAFTSDAGGLESATEWVDAVQDLAEKCGGFDGLREALKTVDSL